MSKKVILVTLAGFFIVVGIILSMIRSPSFIGSNLPLLKYFQFQDNQLSTENKIEEGIKVGVIDGPINKNHPDLNGIPIEQKFFVNHYSDSDVSHATSIAGLLCAKDNNFGVKGMLSEPSIINAVVLSDSTVKQDSLAEAIIYCVDESVEVINISIEIYKFSKELHNSLKYAEQNGIKIFMANGNGGWRRKLVNIEKPTFENLSFVGMVDRSNRKAPSNMKYRKADLYELGSNLISLDKDFYQVCTGTSYSCAIATSKYLILRGGK